MILSPNSEDVETGLYYNRFRYYDSNTGTYISQDPIGLAGNNPNFYAYVHDSNTMVDVFRLSGILTIFSDSPNGDPIGHAFIGVTENGKTTYIGQWPGTADNIGFEKGDLPRLFFSKMEGTLVSPDTSHLRSSELTSISFDLDDMQMSNLKKYVDNFDVENGTKGYNLRNRQCASFAYGASQAAGIKEMKMPWYKWITPASLAKKINSLKPKIKCPS